MEKVKISVEYCTMWGFLPKAISLMDELMNRYQKNIAELAFHPSSGGVFEVTVNGELLFSKKELGRFPEPGEVTGAIARKQGWE